MGLCIATGTGNPCCPGERINERPEKDQTVAVPTGIPVSASLSMRELMMPCKWMAMSWDREMAERQEEAEEGEGQLGSTSSSGAGLEERESAI